MISAFSFFGPCKGDFIRRRGGFIESRINVDIGYLATEVAPTKGSHEKFVGWPLGHQTYMFSI